MRLSKLAAGGSVAGLLAALKPAAAAHARGGGLSANGSWLSWQLIRSNRPYLQWPANGGCNVFSNQPG